MKLNDLKEDELIEIVEINDIPEPLGEKVYEEIIKNIKKAASKKILHGGEAK